MTVSELIAALSSYSPDTVVSINGYEGGITDSFRLIQRTDVALNVNDEWYYGEHEVLDGNATRLIIAR